ncbi:MAG: glycosyltransferase family 4 protein [Ignavibacteria bacterium]|nr:glycosyltransferase family 4 protein [Ignavibacteria bacterium]
MKVAYDAIQLLGHSGIERYSRELIKHVATCDSAVEVRLVTKRDMGGAVAEYISGYDGIEVRPLIPDERQLGAPLRLFMRRIQANTFTKAIRGCDVVHVLGPTKFVPAGVPLVVTIHDLFPMDPSMGLSRQMQRRFPGRIERQLRAASAVVCPSDFVASTIRETYPWFTGSITTTPLAASGAFVPTELSEHVRKRHGIHERYVLFVGRVDPRKNIPRILQAWRALPADVRRSSQLVLLLAGDMKSLQILRQQHAHELNDDSVRIVYEVPSHEMVQLLSAARALVFATLGEGFGLPVVEAMQCGCPVITSDRASLPEVGGDAVLYVNPLQVESIAQAMMNCLSDDALVRDLRSKGIEQAKKFTWSETARKTLEVYHSIT